MLPSFHLSLSLHLKKKQREENYPNIPDVMDMDGMGNFSRFPTDDIKIEERKLKRKKYETLRRTKK